LRLLAMSIAALALYLLAAVFLDLACWMLFPILAVTAWPIWHYQRDIVLFHRRLVLAGIATDDSWVRRRFWAGHISQVLQVFVSLTWATLLLALATVMRPEHWTVVAADVLFLSLMVRPVRRRLAGQVKDEQLGVVARRWPLYALNLLFLTAAFVAVDFFVVGTADTRGLPWHQVAERTFSEVGTAAVCPPAGWITGALATVEQLGWHASQLVIPNLPGPWLRLAAWGVVLMHAGLVAYLFTRLQLGVITLLESTPRGRNGSRGESAFSLAFIYTILFLALPYLYLTLTLADFDTTSLQTGARRAVAWVNPCTTDAAAGDQLLAGLEQDLSRARAVAQADAGRQIDTALDTLFADVELAVDGYLDWYFTVIGEYQRLAASVGGDFAALMHDMLYQHLFEDTRFAERLEVASAEIDAASNVRLAAAAERLGQQTAAAIQARPCTLEVTDLGALGDLDRDRVRAAVATAGGAAIGAMTAKLLAKKAGATLAGKVAAKKGFQAAAGIAGKVAAKKGGSIALSAAAATAVCSPGGPLAVVCGIVAGTVTWLTVDKVMVEIDEALFRDEMRRELLASLAESRTGLAAELKARQDVLIDATALQIQDRLQRVFIPARDGI